MMRPQGRRRYVLIATVILILSTLLFFASAADAQSYPSPSLNSTSEGGLSPAKAAVLGIVEGVTEYLPISSTGHLDVTNRILDIGQTPETKDAADAYTIAIQSGAIVAVLFLYFKRVRSVVLGVFGKDKDGRNLLINLVISFLPAAILGVASEDLIKRYLFGTGPIIAAWIVGGIGILWWVRSRFSKKNGFALEAMSKRTALIIGLAQCVAMWPGTSRSLVTIVAAVVLGASMTAAIEYSFLLGLLTLGAATSYEALSKGGLMVDSFGWPAILIGFITAFIFAIISVKWMVSFLQRRSFAIFGWYRIAIGVVVTALVVTNAI